jgi:hypothetical protein
MALTAVLHYFLSITSLNGCISFLMSQILPVLDCGLADRHYPLSLPTIYNNCRMIPG